MSKTARKHLTAAILFAILVLTAFAFRTYHYNTSVYQLNAIIGDVPQAERQLPPDFFKRFLPYRHNNFSPFTIESAMMFGYAKDIANGKSVPEHDTRLSGIEDIPPYAQMNMALEWALGYSYRIWKSVFPPSPPADYELKYQDDPFMPQFMSAALRLWASLTAGLIFLWLVTLRTPKLCAFGGGFLYAVSTAAIARATGQDIVRGEFCIPLIMICFVTASSINIRPSKWKYPLLFICCAAAFTAWDLSRMIFSAWAAVEILRFLAGMRVTKQRAAVWCVIASAVALNCAFVPFNITYSLWRAELVWVLFPTLAAAFAFALRAESRKRKTRFIVRAAVAFAMPLALYFAWANVINTPEYASNYSHFSEALKAKVQFDNVKPNDPAKLSYDARILWTPSMHSATWETAVTFFPSALCGYDIKFAPLRLMLGYMPLMLSFFALLLVSSLLFSVPRRELIRRAGSLLLPCLFTAGFIAGFIYIVRYHEFLIIFLALSVPLLLQAHLAAFGRKSPPQDAVSEAYTKIYSRRKLLLCIRITLCAVFVSILLWEAFISLRRTRRYTGDVAMADTAHLIEWFRSRGDSVAGKGVAANITTGPMLFAYAGTGVVMNPQFGLKRIRDATEEYLNILYHSVNERDLADYCEKHNARYVLFVRANPDDNPFASNAFEMERLKNAPERVKAAYKSAKEAAWVYSNRYIANSPSVKSGVIARTMYYRPETMNYFVPIPPPEHLRGMAKTYTVFKYIGTKDRKASVDALLKARLDETKCAAYLKESLELDPSNEDAKELYRDIYNKNYTPGL